MIKEASFHGCGHYYLLKDNTYELLNLERDLLGFCFVLCLFFFFLIMNIGLELWHECQRRINTSNVQFFSLVLDVDTWKKTKKVVGDIISKAKNKWLDIFQILKHKGVYHYLLGFTCGLVNKYSKTHTHKQKEIHTKL